jgi:hypothetical protein
MDFSRPAIQGLLSASLRPQDTHHTQARRISMKQLIAIMLASLMLASSAFAATAAPPAANSGTGKSGQPGPNFAARKQKVLSQIAQRILRLQAVQTCVQGAQDHEAMKACRESAGRN